MSPNKCADSGETYTISDADALLLAAGRLCGIRLVDSWPRTHGGDAHVPPRVAGRPGECICDNRDHRRPTGGPGPVQRHLELGEALDLARQRAHAFSVLGEIDAERLLHPAILDQVVEGRAALAVLQAVDHRVAAVV